MVVAEVRKMDVTDIWYTSAHEWCKVGKDSIVIGVTPQGWAEIGNAIYVELPSVGDDVLKEIPFGEIEGTKGTKEISSPADGVVTAVNVKLVQNPDFALKRPMEEGWLIRLKPDAPPALDGMLSAASYAAMTRKKKTR